MSDPRKGCGGSLGYSFQLFGGSEFFPKRKGREREGARKQLLGGPDGPQPLPVFRVQDPVVVTGTSSPRPTDWVAAAAQSFSFTVPKAGSPSVSWFGSRGRSARLVGSFLSRAWARVSGHHSSSYKDTSGIALGPTPRASF